MTDAAKIETIREMFRQSGFVNRAQVETLLTAYDEALDAAALADTQHTEDYEEVENMRQLTQRALDAAEYERDEAMGEVERMTPMTDPEYIEEIRKQCEKALATATTQGPQPIQLWKSVDVLLTAYDEAMALTRRTEAAAQEENAAHCRTIAKLNEAMTMRKQLEDECEALRDQCDDCPAVKRLEAEIESDRVEYRAAANKGTLRFQEEMAEQLKANGEREVELVALRRIRDAAQSLVTNADDTTKYPSLEYALEAAARH